MASRNFYDEHTLFIKCDCASADQIRLAFREALTKYQTAIGKPLDCRFRVNLVENREGKSFGLAFVFVTNPAVYYMFLGKNPDGSDRVEYVDDPSWKSPADGGLTNDAGWSSISEPVYTPGMSWADMTDLEEEYEQAKEAQMNRHVCPKIAVQLEPLMVLPPFKLTAEQIEEKRSKIIADNAGKLEFNSDLVEIPELAYFGVDRAMATAVDSKFMPNILKCSKIPMWVTKEDLKMQFAPYASDPKTLQERFIKGRKVEETYPFVNINDDRVGFVIFDPSTHDAQFALHMMKKTVITKKVPYSTIKETTGMPDPEPVSHSVTLIFGHSYRTDRDLMADISQQPRPVQRRDNTNPPRDNHRSRDVDRRDNRSRDDGDRRVDNRSRDNRPRDCEERRDNRGGQGRGGGDRNIRKSVADAVPQRRQQAQVQRGNVFAALSNMDQ